jgi:hypothetical protein
MYSSLILVSSLPLSAYIENCTVLSSIFIKFCNSDRVATKTGNQGSQGPVRELEIGQGSHGKVREFHSRSGKN